MVMLKWYLDLRSLLESLGDCHVFPQAPIYIHWTWKKVGQWPCASNDPKQDVTTVRDREFEKMLTLRNYFLKWKTKFGIWRKILGESLYRKISSIIPFNIGRHYPAASKKVLLRIFFKVEILIIKILKMHQSWSEGWSKCMNWQTRILLYTDTVLYITG